MDAQGRKKKLVLPLSFKKEEESSLFFSSQFFFPFPFSLPHLSSVCLELKAPGGTPSCCAAPR